jgi:hypothetical protein
VWYHLFLPSTSHLCLTRLNLLLNLRLQILGLLRARPPALDLAIPAHQKLLKVPLDPLQSHEPRLLVLQPLKRRVRLVSVDIDFSQHGERNPIVYLAERLDFVVGARVLAAELVTGEPDDFEIVGVGGLEVFVEFLETSELGGEAAF